MMKMRIYRSPFGVWSLWLPRSSPFRHTQWRILDADSFEHAIELMESYRKANYAEDFNV